MRVEHTISSVKIITIMNLRINAYSGFAKIVSINDKILQKVGGCALITLIL